ncbi:hypothetical protein, partial [Thermococcus sp. GR7]|uniref:hypothetical protein n=1 Tax=Thermococcus sp. GR7 TaxID=1638257 RepID=UPI0014308D04
KDVLSDNPRAFISVYSKPQTLFYGPAYKNTTVTYGPISLSVEGFRGGSVFVRYYQNGSVDYDYFGRGTHVWHGLEITVYNVTNSSALMKVISPRYLTYSVVKGTLVVVQNVNFSPVEVGGIFWFNITVKNIGTSPARYVKVYLYSNSIIQTQEKLQKTLLPTISLPSFQEETPFASYRWPPVQYE